MSCRYRFIHEPVKMSRTNAHVSSIPLTKRRLAPARKLHGSLLCAIGLRKRAAAVQLFLAAYGRGAGVGRGFCGGAHLPAQYLPPVSKFVPASFPPQIIISQSVQTAVCSNRAVGASVMLVAVHVSVRGVYLPSVLKALRPSPPPQTIISLSVHTAVCSYRPSITLVMLVAVHVSVLGLYLPPVFKPPRSLKPPQTIISLPVHTAV
jgi:hypothetical protein